MVGEKNAVYLMLCGENGIFPGLDAFKVRVKVGVRVGVGVGVRVRVRVRDRVRVRVRHYVGRSWRLLE